MTSFHSASNLRESSPCLLVLVTFLPSAPQRRPCPPSLSSQRCLCTPSCRWHLKECIDHQHLFQNSSLPSTDPFFLSPWNSNVQSPALLPAGV
ncbi:unnamed protein product [Gulo gulo]|uniref:Uncharacterized protein n=1 Tax=Gulo gulo TaxID=48420 RepID=A0A9X9LQS4_GULGU|nr:unnamed protein product [Gulo gulo]